MEDRVDEATIKAIPLFRGMKGKELGQIASVFSFYEFPAGATILKWGDPGTSLFIILEGQVQVTQPGRPLVTLGPNEFFGELGAIGFHQTRSVDVVALGRCRCIVSTPGAFPLLVARYPQLSRAIMSEVRERYREGETGSSQP